MIGKFKKITRPKNTIVYLYSCISLNLGLRVRENSFVFPTSFGRGRFQGNLLPFERRSYRKFYLTSDVFRYVIMVLLPF